MLMMMTIMIDFIGFSSFTKSEAPEYPDFYKKLDRTEYTCSRES